MPSKYSHGSDEQSLRRSMRSSDEQSVRRSMRLSAGQSVCGGWSKHPQWVVKVSGVTAVATDCLVTGVNYLIEVLV